MDGRGGCEGLETRRLYRLMVALSSRDLELRLRHNDYSKIQNPRPTSILPVADAQQRYVTQPPTRRSQQNKPEEGRSLL